VAPKGLTWQPCSQLTFLQRGNKIIVALLNDIFDTTNLAFLILLVKECPKWDKAFPDFHLH